MRRGDSTFPVAHAAAVAAVAVLLQVMTFLIAGRAGPLPTLLQPMALVLDYRRLPLFAIPALEGAFIARSLRARPALSQAPVATTGPSPPASAGELSLAATPSATSSSRPTPSPAPTPSRRPTIRPARFLTAMTADRKTVRGGDLLTYTVYAEHVSGGPARGTFNVTSHVPLHTTACSDAVVVAPCIVPGSYDGESEDPGDAHLFPAPTQHTLMLERGQRRDLLVLRVSVSHGAPSGTTLRNHAHVEIVGDGAGTFTIKAPQVQVE